MSVNPNDTGSSRSAFDALMSNARSVASKKKSQSLLVKRKTPEPVSANEVINTETEDGASTLCEQALVSTHGEKISHVISPKDAHEEREPYLLSNEESLNALRAMPEDFDPSRAAYWKKETTKGVPFLFIARTFDMISKESGRIVITNLACNMLRTVMHATPHDLLAVVYLSSNRIAPAHEGLELGIGDAIIIKALAEACGEKESHIKKQYKELGDLGLVAKTSRSSQSLMRKPDALQAVKVFDTFKHIAKETGKDSQEKKKNRIKSLLVAANDCEPLYLIRLLQGKLRIKLAEQTLLAALAQASVYNEKLSSSVSRSCLSVEEAEKIIKQVYSVLPDYDKIVGSLLSGGVCSLSKECVFTPGIPVGPMLAKATKGVSEVIEKFQDTLFTCEFKYDGERAQIHFLDNGNVEIYSRNAEKNTGKFPDVVVTVSRLKKAHLTSFVIDCELVAYDRANKKILPFQILSTRARKNVVASDIKVDVCVFAFDILYHNGQPLIQEQLALRRKHLHESFEEESGYFQFATFISSSDVEEIQNFLEASVDGCCEGLIIKTLDSDATYEPSKRSLNWLKLKKDYMESVGDSLDLVPIAAFHGRGKRAGLYGAFLLACYDSSNEEFQSICKIGTGFSDANLKERSSSLLSKVIPRPKPYYRFAESTSPDVWFEPAEVWEVKAADLTISPVHCAAVGLVDREKGISLRFPRLLRVRDDKTPEQATSSEQVAEMYSAQKHNHPQQQQLDGEQADD